MWIFLVDEDMPRSTAIALNAAGYVASDVRNVGLRGRSDHEVFAYAQAEGATLVTADKGFSNLLQYPLGSHAGIIVVRVPNELPTQQVNQEIIRALVELDSDSLHGLLVIVETGRTRIRRPPEV